MEGDGFRELTNSQYASIKAMLGTRGFRTHSHDHEIITVARELFGFDDGDDVDFYEWLKVAGKKELNRRFAMNVARNWGRYGEAINEKCFLMREIIKQRRYQDGQAETAIKKPAPRPRQPEPGLDRQPNFGRYWEDPDALVSDEIVDMGWVGQVRTRTYHLK